MNSLLKFAEQEVGYLEKKSKAELDSKTANAGMNNYTKYWAEMAPGMQGQPWCACFVDYCFKKVYGVTKAKELLFQQSGWTYYTPTMANYFKKNNQWFNTPQVGDIIFFKNSTRICHVGIVYKVSGGTVYTIEGNTSTGPQVEANGGGVCKKQYSLSNSRIAGYGRPLYPRSAQQTPAFAYTQKDLRKDIQSIGDIETIAKTVTISYRKNARHVAVKPIQKYLNSLGYNCGVADGIAGARFNTALKMFQRQWMRIPDGEITAGGETWKRLLGI